MYCYLYAAESGLQYNKCPYYEICAHQFHIKHDEKLHFSLHCLFGVRQRLAYMLLWEPSVPYSVAYAQVLIIFETVYVTIIERNLLSQ